MSRWRQLLAQSKFTYGYAIEKLIRDELTSSVGMNLTCILTLCPGISTPVGGISSNVFGFGFSGFNLRLRCIGMCLSMLDDCCKTKSSLAMLYPN